MQLKQIGFEYAIELALDTISKADLDNTKKGDMMFSFYALRCVFGEYELSWQDLCTKYSLKVDNALIQKYELFDLVYALITLKNASDELKAIWYLMFVYVLLLEPPFDKELFDRLLDLLANEPCFDATLSLEYSIYAFATIEELEAQLVPSSVIEWLKPYIDYKNALDENGFSREVLRFQRWLSEGRFYDVFAGSERLLDCFVDDENLLLVNIASRVSLDREISKEDKEKLLRETISLIDDALSVPKQKKELFLYYQALGYLGLQNVQTALEKFKDCLDVNPSFVPAKNMLKALDAD